jgi:hypothetical protein
MRTDSESLRDWLKAKSLINDLHRAVMSARYDLDGALDSGQLGLAWRSQENLLHLGLHLYLVRAGVSVTQSLSDERIDRAVHLLESLRRVQPSLCGAAWDLLLRPVPPAERLPAELDRTLAFLQRDLHLPWISSRQETVLRWADDTRVLRALAREFGIAQSDEWYLNSTSPGKPTDWYGDLVRTLEEEQG